MLKFAANLTTMYGSLPFLDGFAAAAADGFTAVEYRSPFEAPIEAIAEQLQAHDLTHVQFNFPMGDMAAGDRGLACLPDRVDEFRESLDLALRYATKLGCPQLNCIAGLTPEGDTGGEAEAVLVANLQLAAAKLADAGIRLQLEALNRIDTPGCHVASTDDFERIHEKVGSDNLYLQYDFYHMQIMQGDLVRTFARLQPLINHVQIADNPGRHEPGTGEINYDFILGELERLGYQGWVGCEYVPATTAGEGLGWLHERLQAPTPAR